MSSKGWRKSLKDEQLHNIRAEHKRQKGVSMRKGREWSLTLKLWRCNSFSSSSEKLAENMNLKMGASMALYDREK
jgi:hypothetical protein